ncbi:hypothetical protein [uncultured Paraglaciecola sp.]|uniref:hypothetical protein n=1 Tax=uncultured Paraglaciecola sp. TaxID=1765024 RepID=UPI002619C776|nr:hypothetical protein [uncultured Paraglaciecola sp.]
MTNEKRRVTNVDPQQLIEHINEINFHETGVARVGVVQGYEIDGNFQPLPGQNAQPYQLMFEDFEKVFGDPDVIAAVNTLREKIWPIIDLARQGRDATTVREIARQKGL